VEPDESPVEKKNEKGETIKGADDKPVMEEQTVTEQNIVQGPMASQVAIKMLARIGGGYVNANAAHPFENPTRSQISSRCFPFSRSAADSLITLADGEEPEARMDGLGAMSILFVGACCSVGGPSPQAIRFITNSALLPPTAI